MRLTASTHITDGLCEPFTDEIEIMQKFGFEGMDFGLNFDISEKFGDRWQEKVEKFAEKAYENDMPIVQTHLPYSFPQGTSNEVKFESTKKAILASELLGSPYAVFHAVNPVVASEGYALTHELYMPLVEYGKKHGVDLLVEIMPNFCTYPITAEQLCDCADRMDIGICWDFGHPNVNKYHLPNDQRDEIRYVGKRLKAVHINDNAGGRPDQHLPPFMGSVDWNTHIPVLKEIGYEGDFNYEFLPRNIPHDMYPLIAEYLVTVGRRLMTLCE